ncbi:nucleotidyltransferase family protein [Limnohabitans sp. Rim8]|uniref:nucleotidyltransferase family protein n=1 Tax=Limnohabitans sp. Rim8 TaxID=1100718 RepID=UPI00261A1FC5|nr:nucleotidyltransferase family protein [Limnohabitans sp. Rim8]
MFSTFDAQAMVLAAGRGERMRPLTDHIPKPMLQVRGQPLMQWPMQALARGGFVRQLVNTAWLGEKIPAHFGERITWAGLPEVEIAYSHEGQDFGHALETAGGIVRALPHLAEVFWVVAGDVFAPDFVFAPGSVRRFAASTALAHLWLVPNPAHNPSGDFGLSASGQILNLAKGSVGCDHTFSTIALYKRSFFAGCGLLPGNPDGVALALAPLLRAAMDRGLVTGEVYAGDWTDVGTPERLAQLNRDLPRITA